MPRTQYKCLSKAELHEANRQAIKAGGRAIDPDYVGRLPEGLRFPVVFMLPWERRGWVRCQIGTATSIAAQDYMPVWLDVPQSIYDNLSSVEVQDNMEVTL